MKAKLFSLVCALLIPLSAFSAITRVQSISGTTGATAATTLVLVLPSTPTAGNVIILAVATNANTVTLPYGNNITWTNHLVHATNAVDSSLFIGRVFASASATITITSPQANPIAAVACEYSGTNIIADRGSDNTGNSTSASTGTSATTSTANEMWIGALAHRSTGGSTYSAPSNSFAIVDQQTTTVNTTNTDRSVCFLELAVSSTGTASTGATVSVSNNWAGQTMTLREIIVTGSGASSHVWGN